MFLNRLGKRDWDDSDGDWASAGGARWAFFAIFVVLVLIVILGTIRVNKRRGMRGAPPIYGTRWITPPSYYQSEQQYNRHNHGDVDYLTNYVPAYTAEATENDMGYYDKDGNFKLHPSAKQFMNNDLISYPGTVHMKENSVSHGVPLNDITENPTASPHMDLERHA